MGETNLFEAQHVSDSCWSQLCKYDNNSSQKTFTNTNTDANVFSIIYEMQWTNPCIPLNMPSLLSFVCFMENLAKQSNKRLTTRLLFFFIIEIF